MGAIIILVGIILDHNYENRLHWLGSLTTIKSLQDIMENKHLYIYLSRNNLPQKSYVQPKQKT